MASKVDAKFPRGSFTDKDLYLNTVDLVWIGTCVIAKAYRRSKPGPEVFYVAWNAKHIRKAIGPAETDEQAVFVSIARAAPCKAHLHAVPNGGFRQMEQAVKMKREGMSRGAPDIIVWGGTPAPRITTLPILGIEFKRNCGVLSDFSAKQLAWMEYIHTSTGGRADACGAFGHDAGLAMMEYRGYNVPPRDKDKHFNRLEEDDYGEPD